MKDKININKEKIILMSKLAMYEKNIGKEDFKINSYFRHDYIYKKNFGIRLSALIGGVVIIFLAVVHKIAIGGEDILMLNFVQEGMKIALFLVFIAVMYSILGVLINTLKYESAVTRLEKYYDTIDKLDEV